jgi:inhibitor of cysteine peptidase
VRVPETATTGYRWQVERSEGLVAEGDSYDLGTNMQPGAGGVREFRFRATAPTTTTLELKHWRHWEGESSVTERLSADITVAD